MPNNNVCTRRYLNEILQEIPKIVPEYLRVGDAETPFESLSPNQIEDLTQLLPDRWLESHPEYRNEDRQRELEVENQRRRKRLRLRRRPVAL